jgi:hypothetical protein
MRRTHKLKRITWNRNSGRLNQRELIGYFNENPMMGQQFEFFTKTEEGYQKVLTSNVKEVFGDRFMTSTGSTYEISIL